MSRSSDESERLIDARFCSVDCSSWSVVPRVCSTWSGGRFGVTAGGVIAGFGGGVFFAICSGGFCSGGFGAWAVSFLGAGAGRVRCGLAPASFGAVVGG